MKIGSPDKPQDNYKRIDQVNSETGKLWGAEDRIEDFNEYVNREGHSFLQYTTFFVRRRQ